MVHKYYMHSILCISAIILKEIPLKLGCPLEAVFYVQQVGVLITLLNSVFSILMSHEYKRRTELYIS
jgi:hypothetical protein